MERKKILIADDETEVLQMLTEKLQKQEYRVTGVLSGSEVMQRCKIRKPDLVILDIAMPDMGGYAVAHALHQDKELENVPILFLTGKELDHRGIEKRIEELGAYDYLMKPCTLEDLTAKIKEIIG